MLELLLAAGLSQAPEVLYVAVSLGVFFVVFVDY